MRNRDIKIFRVADVAVFVAVIILTVIIVYMGLGRKEPSKLSVRVGDVRTEYSLDLNEEYEINSNGVTLSVKITDGKVCVASSTCKDKICVNSGEIYRTGQTIVCAPAQVAIEIIAKGDSEVDATVR